MRLRRSRRPGRSLGTFHARRDIPVQFTEDDTMMLAGLPNHTRSYYRTCHDRNTTQHMPFAKDR